MGKERRVRDLAAFVAAEGLAASNPCRQRRAQRSGRGARQRRPARQGARGIKVDDHAAQIEQQCLNFALHAPPPICPQRDSPPALERLVRAVCGCFAGPAPAVWTGEACPASDWGRRDRPGTAATASTTATPICSSRSCCANMAQSRAALRAVLEDPMTTASEGMELTRVGAGTIMGELMRCYWLPAALSSELVRDGAPVRLLLLGEKLVAFRDSAGRVGVMDHRCPHRCASLFLGRNEEGGLRCIYHGWKFDVAGNCLDMPS